MLPEVRFNSRCDRDDRNKEPCEYMGRHPSVPKRVSNTRHEVDSVLPPEMAIMLAAWLPEYLPLSNRRRSLGRTFTGERHRLHRTNWVDSGTPTR